MENEPLEDFLASYLGLPEGIRILLNNQYFMLI